MTERTTTGSRYLAEALQAYGVTHVFMVPTIAVGALKEMAELGMTVVLAHSEKAAAYMADGYARVTGRPGVCLAQTVGAANLASGLRDAWLAGSPVLALTGGRTPMTVHRHVYQEIADQPLFRQVTKWSAEVDDVRRVPDLLRQAFREATSGAPGPVHLQFQRHEAQVLDEELVLGADSGPLNEPRFAAAPAFRPAPDPDATREAVARIRAAKRPVLVAGGGVTRSGAGRELLAFAEAAMVPVATTLNGKGSIAEDHPLALGVVGSYSRRPANQAVLDADLVVYVGSRTGSQTTAGWLVPPIGTAVIQLDIDPAELGRNYPNEVSLLGDARAGLEALVAAAEQAGGPPAYGRRPWIARVAELVAAWRADMEAPSTSDAQPLRPERLCRELAAVLPDDAVLVSDTGHAGIWTGSLVELRPGQTYLRAAGSLGWAIPAALGAKVAVPDRPVVCFTGDGGAYYHLTELETAVRHGIPAVVVVNNNRSLSQDMMIFDRAYNGEQTPAGRGMWMFGEVDFAAVARDLGCAAYRVERPSELAPALRAALLEDRPALVDVVTDLHALPERSFGGGGSYG